MAQKKQRSSQIMSCPIKALPTLSPQHRTSSFFITFKNSKFSCNSSKHKNSSTIRCSRNEAENFPELNSSSLAIQIAALLSTTAVEPAMAVTGVNNEPDLKLVLIKSGIVAFGYFLIMPPIILNWMRLRWYRRGLLEMYVQFMLTFIFFPGVLLWAPFLNFRKFPRDPSMKYPWSKPEDPSQVRGGFLKFPWASIEDYE